MKNQAIVELDVLSALRGHDEEKIIIKDDNPQKRKQLAEKVDALLRDGFAVLLADGVKVRGYDPETNEWLVAASDRKNAKKRIWDCVKALGSVATAVAPSAGG